MIAELGLMAADLLCGVDFGSHDLWRADPSIEVELLKYNYKNK